MLSNIASYLGYQITPTEEEADVAAGVDMQLCPVEEDEWLLVEKQKSDEVGSCPSVLPLTRPSTLQESWYLTPPPSFTSRGPIHMEMSPLENLLIEHPSMSVYQKTEKAPGRKTRNSSPSASEEESILRPSSEDELPSRVPLPRKERFHKIPRNKYSKKATNKKVPTSSNDDVLPVPSRSKDETHEVKEAKVKNFVKSPRRSMNAELKNFSKKPVNRRDGMISIPPNSEVDPPAISALAIQPFAPTRKLYSEVLRSKPAPVPVQPQIPENPPANVSRSASPAQSVISISVPVQPQIQEKVPFVENPPVNASQLASPVQSVISISVPVQPQIPEENPSVHASRSTSPVQSQSETSICEAFWYDSDGEGAKRLQHRQGYLNRSAQKLEQRKTCEMAKRNPLGRNNKAREINSRNKRQRRSDMMHRHSGANNNRKCY